jgi:alkylated DNA repair dioxygenase AlkB
MIKRSASGRIKDSFKQKIEMSHDKSICGKLLEFSETGNLFLIKNLPKYVVSLLKEKALLSATYDVGNSEIARFILEALNVEYERLYPHITNLTDRASLIVYKNFQNSSMEDFEGLPLQHNPQAVIYGRTVTMHRDIGFFSDVSSGYRFSGQIIRATNLTPLLRCMMDKVNIISSKHTTNNSKFNSILVNLYHDNNDYIGAHSDDESTLVGDCVAALSFGETRRFIVTRKKGFNLGEQKVSIDVSNGDLLFMAGPEFQKRYTHEIPKESKVRGSRLSLTFRHHTS